MQNFRRCGIRCFAILLVALIGGACNSAEGGSISEVVAVGGQYEIEGEPIDERHVQSWRAAITVLEVRDPWIRSEIREEDGLETVIDGDTAWINLSQVTVLSKE